MEFSQILGDWHLRIVPFPIVLLLTALILDSGGLVFRSERALWAGKWLMGLGTVTLLVAFICGICAEIWAGRAAVPHEQIKWHELAATVAAWGFIGLTSWRLFLDGNRRKSIAVYLICGFTLYGMVTLAGHFGGELVTEYGAAVRGGQADTVLSYHDLNTLAQRQTDKNLQYSDVMHHSAGWMVLALSLTLFVRERWPHKASKLWWVDPSLLAVGGVLLFLFADLDLYDLTDIRQFYDREVQMHKLLAVVMVAIGIRAMVKQSRVSCHETATQTHFQNRLIAVFALIGGGALFTYVHTVAPYANVAAGVYIHHIAMGCVALTIGIVKLLDDALPNKKRWRSMLFPCVMTVEAFLLITYTEGTPWWLGIGHYNRWGPNGGSIASFGQERAELVYSPETATMDVRFFKRFEDHPLGLSITNIALIVQQGYRETVVPLKAVNAQDGLASRFQGHARFLKDASQFDARVAIPLRNQLRTGYFDPWVTPSIVGIPPNELARFVCPMHEGIRTKESGLCPLCQMPLILIQTNSTGELHDSHYRMELSVDQKDISANKPVQLILSPYRTDVNEIVSNLRMVHEYLCHLIIVNQDLSYFDHVHPVRQPDGTFTINYTFPSGGQFILFADISTLR